MIQVTFNREATYRHLISSGPTRAGLHYRRWDMTSKGIAWPARKPNYRNISDASVARLFRVAMEYGYWFEVH